MLKRIICGALLLSAQVWADGVDTWDLLLPATERETKSALEIDHNAPMTEAALQNRSVSLNNELNGSKIRIPGFVVPLEGDAQKVTEFLLVPYFGACLHYPPPPPNQIIYVSSAEGIAVSELWDAIWVEGVIKTEVQDVDGEFLVGYKIDNPTVEVYQD